MRYIARPDEIEAIQWVGHIGDIPVTWRLAEAFEIEAETGDLIVPTVQGPSHARLGWYVAHCLATADTDEEFYPISPERFHQRWEAVTTL